MKIGNNDLDNDPETATDLALWNDMAADNVIDGATDWEATYPDYAKYVTIPLQDQDYLDKNSAHGDWYGVSFVKKSGSSIYAYIRSSTYTPYVPFLLVEYRVPYQLKVNVKNLDPILDTTDMKVSPTTVKEGDDVNVTGITYTDGGKCDTHHYRVIIELGPGLAPVTVVDWTEAKDGKIDFSFKAPDDDPEDADLDISKDDVTLIIELRDDDYVPDLHYDKVYMELNCYEYYLYAPYKDWGAYHNLKPWSENTVTLSSYPRNSAYTKSTPEDIVKPHGPKTSPYSTAYNYYSYEITSLFGDWMDGSEENYGLRVMPTTAGRDTSLIRSSDYANYGPRLRIELKEPLMDDISYQPSGADMKDAMLRAGTYSTTNYGTYSYLVYVYSTSTSYPEAHSLMSTAHLLPRILRHTAWSSSTCRGYRPRRTSAESTPHPLNLPSTMSTRSLINRDP